MSGSPFKKIAPALIVLLGLALLVAGSNAGAQAPQAGNQAGYLLRKDNETVIHPGKWLLLGPAGAVFPAFNDEEKKDNDAAFLLSQRDMAIESLLPEEGKKVNTFGEETLNWIVVPSDSNGVLLARAGKDPAVAYLAAWIDAPRWMKIGIEAVSTGPFEIFIDGKSVVKCVKSAAAGKAGDKQSGSAKISRGKHLLVAKAAYAPGDSIAEWRLDASLTVTKNFKDVPSISLDPTVGIDISRILDAPNVRSISVSPDGRQVLIGYWKFTPPDGGRESWTEIRNLPDGTLAETMVETQMSDVEWVPGGRRLSYVSRSGKSGSVRILDLDSGRIETVLGDIADLGGYSWSPDGSFIVYYTEENYKDDGSGIKRLQNIGDRTENGRNRTSVYIASVPGGTVRKLATGKFDSFVNDISPDGRKLLLSRGYEDLSERPFGKTELILLDLGDMSTKLLHRGHWMGNASWSPSGDRILVEGGPSTFGEIGRNVPEGVIPNDYDGQLYILDPSTGDVEAITRNFDPAVKKAVWSGSDDNIYIVAEKGSLVKLFRYDTRRKAFSELDTGVDVISSGGAGVTADISRTSPVCVFAGSGASAPQRIYSINLKKGPAKEIDQPGRDLLRNVRLGKSEDFDFISEEGRKITGYVKYPPISTPRKNIRAS